MRRGGIALGVKKVEEIYNLKEQGASSRQIASKAGITYNTAQGYMRLSREGGIRKAKEMEEALKPLPISLAEIKSDAIAAEWINSYDGTSRVPELGLQYFCNLVKKKPRELIEEATHEIKNGKLLSERKYIGYMEQFRQWLKGEGYAPITALNYVSAIRAFYSANFIDLPRKRKRKSNVVQALEGNRNHRVQREDIRDMLAVCRHLRDKAVILCAISSGMGSAELRNLKVGHFGHGLDNKYGICKIRTIRVKTGLEFITFLSTEAVDMIWEYLTKERKITPEDIKTHLEEPLFAEVRDTYSRPDIYKPLSPGALGLIFKNISNRLDRYHPNLERDKKNIIQNELRSHNMRKFFNTELKNAGCPDQAVETMLAHKTGVKDAYYLKNEDALRDLYLKYMPALTIQPIQAISHDEEVELLRQQLKEQEKKIEALEEQNKTREPYDDRIDKLMRGMAAEPEMKKMMKGILREIMLEEKDIK